MEHVEYTFCSWKCKLLVFFNITLHVIQMIGITMSVYLTYTYSSGLVSCPGCSPALCPIFCRRLQALITIKHLLKINKLVKRSILTSKNCSHNLWVTYILENIEYFSTHFLELKEKSTVKYLRCYFCKVSFKKASCRT